MTNLNPQTAIDPLADKYQISGVILTALRKPGQWVAVPHLDGAHKIDARAAAQKALKRALFGLTKNFDVNRLDNRMYVRVR